MLQRFTALIFLLAMSFSPLAAETLVYIGTYTKGNSGSEGIYLSRLNEDTGTLSAPELVAKLENPSFVAISPDKQFLYAVSEVGSGDEKTMGVFAYRIEEDGTLEALNSRSTGGAAACHLMVHPTGKLLAVANYTGGSTASFPIAKDGSLGERASLIKHQGSSVNARRQQEPHAHSLNFSPDGKQALVADLGADKLFIYDVDTASAKLTPAAPADLSMPAGGGPRHLCFAPEANEDGSFFVASNLELTSEVTLLSYDPNNGQLTMLKKRSTLPDGESVPGNSTAECLIHPSGRFVYVSNRGHNSIAVFRLNHDRQTLRLVQNQSTSGEIPRGFGITPDGRFLVAGNQNSGNVVSMQINPKNGKLTPVEGEIEVGAPVNVRFLVK